MGIADCDSRIALEKDRKIRHISTAWSLRSCIEVCCTFLAVVFLAQRALMGQRVADSTACHERGSPTRVLALECGQCYDFGAQIEPPSLSG